MSSSLRVWQKNALEVYREKRLAGVTSLLWEATPGAGKTVAALTLCREELKSKKSKRVIIIVPTTHLKIQWAKSAAKYNLQLDYTYGEKKGYLSQEFHGAVLTYQQMGSQPRRFARLAHDAVIVLDEVHHAGEGLTWGNALTQTLKDSSFRLCLSGTAFRSDNNPIPFIRYSKTGVSEPDYVYSYSQAISDRVCRPTVFITYGGDVAWKDDVSEYQVNFSDSLDKLSSTKRLRAALDADSRWMEPMIRDADEMLTALRQEHSDAGGLLVASNQKNAKALSRVLYAVTGEKPVVVLSEDAQANQKLKDYTASSHRWLVACNMVSEGVDIPRLRVGIFATTIRTKMYFRQFLGRIVRKTPVPQGLQTAFFYLPADPWLKKLAEEIETEQKHYLKSQESDFLEFELDPLKPREKKDTLLSWKALTGSNSGVDSVISGGGQLSLWAMSPQDMISDSQDVYTSNIPAPEQILSKAEVKEEIAKEITSLVRRYHRNTGKPHAHIHSLLNKRQAVKSQNECTEKQLRERLALIEKLLHQDRGA